MSEELYPPEVRAQGWVCEAISDSIRRLQHIIEFDKDRVQEERSWLEKERTASYATDEDIARREQRINECLDDVREGAERTNELQDLLREAQALRTRLQAFWDKRTGREKRLDKEAS